ncbi:MAG: amphi-Trp domain-containing protein [Anaerolineae bacterium]|jgi:amphi-Trp domain-containing protein
MAKKSTLFRAEEWKSRQSTAAFLRELADNLEAGEVILRRGDDEINLALPETVELEIKVREKVKEHKTERELEIEIEWTQEQAEGTVTLG